MLSIKKGQSNAFMFFQSLYIRSCDVVYVHPSSFTALFPLYTLAIERCNLTRAPPLHAIKRSLTRLKLANNQIEELNEDYFAGCDKLEYVN